MPFRPGRHSRRRPPAARRVRLSCEWLEDRRLLSAGGLTGEIYHYDYPDVLIYDGFTTTNDAALIAIDMLWAPPVIAADAAGNYVVAWIGTASGDGTIDLNQTVRAQRYNAAGEAIGDAIVLWQGHVFRDGSASALRIAMSAEGQFVVGWSWTGSVFTEYGPAKATIVQRFSADGTPLGGQFSVAGATSLDDLALNASGDLFVAFTKSPPYSALSYLLDPPPLPNPEVMVQRYSADGSALGDAILLGTGIGTRLAMGADGSFVATWQDTSPHPLGVVAQAFNSDGTPRTARIRVSWLAGHANLPDVGMDASGAFVVAWIQESGGKSGIFAQRFDAWGNFLGAPLTVSEPIAMQLDPLNVAVDEQGNFYVTWNVFAPSTITVFSPKGLFLVPQAITATNAAGDKQVLARAYDAGGRPLGDAFSVDASRASQGVAATALGPSGSLIMTWTEITYISSFVLDDRGGTVAQAIANSTAASKLFVQQFDVPRTPILDLNGLAAGIDDAANYQPGDAAVPISPELVLRNFNAAQPVSARVAIDGALAGDVLAADTQGANITVSYADGVLTLLGADSVENYQQVLRSVTFVTTADRAVGSNVKVHFTINDGMDDTPAATSTISIYEPGLSAVVGRHTFYNNSGFDGQDPTANAGDDGAIATDKTALLPGQSASFANYTSYSRGLNGIMIDLGGTHGQISADDFVFHVGGAGDASGWAFAPQPTSVIVRPGAGAGGADRVEIVWADGAIQDAWLEVIVLANGNTGLAAADTFYFGNLVADTGNSSIGMVTPSDVLRAINYYISREGLHEPVSVEDLYDFNRDGRVTAADVLIGINRVLAGTASRLELISPAAAAQTAGAFASTSTLAADSPSQQAAMNQLAVAAAMQIGQDEEPDWLADAPVELLLPTRPLP